MSVETAEELAGLGAAGRVVADALKAMRRAARPHVSTADSAGSGEVRIARDGWTIRTADGAMSAHVEHSIVVRDGAPLILTA